MNDPAAARPKSNKVQKLILGTLALATIGLAALDIYTIKLDRRALPAINDLYTDKNGCVQSRSGEPHPDFCIQPSAGTGPSSQATPDNTQAACVDTNVLAGFFTIAALGVQFPYPKQLARLTCTVDSSSAGPFVEFHSSALSDFADARDPANTCLSPYTTLGLLYRDRTKPEGPAGNGYSGEVAHFGTYYYGYTFPQEFCSSNNAIQDRQVDLMDTLIRALKALRPVQ
jgi:hypothetical protein